MINGDTCYNENKYVKFVANEWKKKRKETEIQIEQVALN